MAVPKYNEFFPYYLLALKDGQVRSTKEAIEYCADAFELSPEDCRVTIASGQLLYANRAQ